VKCLGLRPVGSSRKPAASRGARPDERQDLETHQRRLLRQFIDGRVTGREHRDPELAVDRVVALGVSAQHVGVEDPAPDDDGAVVEVVARSDVSLLGQRRCLDIGYLTSS